MNKIKIFGLGGLNEVGKNMYVITVNEDIFVFDAGLKYAEDQIFGIDYIMPDFTYLKENHKNIKGVFLTHGHDENIGSVCDIIREIPSIKIYGSKFTLSVLKEEMNENNIVSENLIEIKAYQRIGFKENSVFPISVTHSLPDSLGYVLNTVDGAIVYTGDFTFDSTMSGPYKTDMGKLAYIGKQGVLALLTDSTYADKTGHTSPNHRASDYILNTLIKYQNRMIVSVFTYSVYRLQELFDEIDRTNRKAIIMGKKFQTFINNAIEMGYMNVKDGLIGDLSHINDNNAVIIVSNDRENSFVNLSRIINGYDKFVKLNQNDTVFFLENIYDSIERQFVRLSNQIAKMGMNVVSLPSKTLLHHASREDLLLMIDLINPKYYIPIKGEYRYQYANALLGEEYGIAKENIILKQNGEVIVFEDGNLIESFELVKTGEILIDGKSTEDISELVLKDREVLSDNGIVLVSATLDRRTKEILSGPEIITRGFIYVKDNQDLMNEMVNISESTIKENITNNYIEYNKIRLNIREKLGKYLYKETECKPMIITIITEI